MKLSRARFLGGTAALAGGLSLTGCIQAERYLTRTSVPNGIGRDEATPGDPAWRVLNRIAYGPRPGDLERVHSIGVRAYIEEQLHPETIEEEPAAWGRLLHMDTLDADAAEAEDFETAVYPEVGKGQSAVELQQAMVLRSVYSRRQLEQVMVEFWTDHFNISQLKAECSWLKTVDDRQIRKHALGKFRDLITASAHSPAMLFYLDNDKNHRRDPKTGSGANENYARELLELHTLGVDGGYTLKDIQEVARCFSGWSYRTGFRRLPFQDTFVYRPEVHDDGAKEVLGVPIPPGQGVRDGQQVIDILCRHPNTARFVARKLCRRFLADLGPNHPPQGLVERLATTFRRSDGDIRTVLAELLHSEEFLQGKAGKLKRPFDYVVSALRATNADTAGRDVLAHLERMGQLPFKWAMPDGYPDRADAWAPSLLARWNFAVDLLGSRIGDTRVDLAHLESATSRPDEVGRLEALTRVLLGRAPDAALTQRLLGLEGGWAPRMALLLAGPDFMWR